MVKLNYLLLLAEKINQLHLLPALVQIISVNANVKKLKTVSFTGDESDAKLTFDKPGKPIIAFRNFKYVNPGKVVTLYLHPAFEENGEQPLTSESMEEGYSREFDLNGTSYTLRVSKGVQKDGTKVGVLVLETNGVKQVIDTSFYNEGDKIIIGSLLWAGDLNNDGKLDIYIDQFDEKGGFGGYLFLSSAINDSDLVKLVAIWGLAGC